MKGLLLTRLRTLTKNLLNNHRPGGCDNAIILSTPRSGSTWLTELVLSDKRFKICDEPFNVRDLEVQKYLGISSWDELYSNHFRVNAMEYLSALAEGKKYRGTLGKLMPIHNGNRFVTSRIVFKILHCCENWVDEMGMSARAKTIFLIRHPIPVSLSRKTLPRLRTFLESDFKMNLTDDQLDLALGIMEKGDHLQRSMLSWSLQNFIPLTHRSETFLTLTYEQLVMDPIPAVQLLQRHFALEDLDGILAHLDTPSSTTVLSNRATQEKLKYGYDRDYLVSRWKKEVDDSKERQLMEIPSIFGISCYRFSSLLPDTEFWIK